MKRQPVSGDRQRGRSTCRNAVAGRLEEKLVARSQDPEWQREARPIRERYRITASKALAVEEMARSQRRTVTARLVLLRMLPQWRVRASA